MFKETVASIRGGRSPLLLTGVEGELLGKTAMTDGQTRIGDERLFDLLPDRIDKLPRMENGVLIEHISTAPELILCGGGHVSVQVAKIAKLIGFSVTVIDDRPEFANTERFPQAQRIVCLPFPEALDKIQSTNAYYVIVTRGHRWDRECLKIIAPVWNGFCKNRLRTAA